MVDHPTKYRWSSYAANALGVSNSVLTPHGEYFSLGHSLMDCQSVYRSFLHDCSDADELVQLRCALQTGTPLSNEKFKTEIEDVLARKVGFPFRGRPRHIFEKGGQPPK
ncbi:hypothetical protein CCP3SC1_420019 [Gammaproteobacteria bacterium]